MTPYRNQSTVGLNPTIKASNFIFGAIHPNYLLLTGRVVETSYFNPKREMAYLIDFNEGQSEDESKRPKWFLEHELIPVYSK